MAEPTKTSRRAFLTGKSATEALADAVLGPPPQLPPPQGLRPAERQLLSVSREAMACLFEVVFDAARYRGLTDAAIEALELVSRLEDQLTIYRETSEVARLNRRAADEAVAVEKGLFRLLQRAVALHDQTGGAFDITAGPLAKTWGFYRRQGQMPAAGEIAAALAPVGSRHLQLDEPAHSVRFLRPGMELNLGAIGKGYALDRAADALVAAGISDFLLHGGNSSVIARGNRILDFGLPILDSKNKGDQPLPVADQSKIQNPQSKIHRAWSVALRHPLRPDVRLAEFDLCDQALGTSGSGTQFFHHQGKRFGHILDPRTGWPADKVLSVTVIAPTAEQADALSTALYVMGLEEASEFCTSYAEISALLTTQSGVGQIDLHPLNLPADRWRILG
ncbi:MAG TPA: FAD:protein FMN transferase [Pirellulaceae bacterium]|nr:FAD:protein FMN transferase [Pirellulaceae bacterium]